MKATVEGALSQADNYAQFAIANLSLSNWRREDELDQAIESFRIHFLFPTLSEADRLTLLAAVCLRRALQLGIATLHRNPSNPDLKGMERNVREYEKSLVEIAAGIRSASFYSSLTQLQTEVLQTEILTIPPFQP